MALYSVWIKVFGTEDEMVRPLEEHATSADAGDSAIVYFKDHGNGPLSGLIESDPRGTETNGDYVCVVTPG